MAIVKYPLIRYRIIDELLNRKKYVKTKEFCEAVRERFGSSITGRQIRNDIDFMKGDDGYRAPIAYCRRERAFYYEYQFSIQALHLDQKEIESLEFAAALIWHYKESGFFRGISNAIGKIKMGVDFAQVPSQDFRQSIQPEDLPMQRGQEHLPVLLEAINAREVLRISYRKFQQERDSVHHFHPYVLKEYQNLWYVIGYSELRSDIRSFAVDRIQHIDRRNASFVMLKGFDPISYFRHSFGVTVMQEKPIRLVLQFTKRQGDYLKVVPIHRTQEIIEENEEGLKVVLTTYPTYELFMKLLSYGENVVVLEPQSVAVELRDRLMRALTNYT